MIYKTKKCWVLKKTVKGDKGESKLIWEKKEKIIISNIQNSKEVYEAINLRLKIIQKYMKMNFLERFKLSVLTLEEVDSRD